MDDNGNEEKAETPKTIRTGVKNGTVTMEFQESVRGIYMSPLEAMVIARNLLNAAIGIVEKPQKIVEI